MDPAKIEQIAQVCHEANRAYCDSIGDFSQLSWPRAADWQRNSAKKGVEFHLEQLERGEKTSPAASHVAWMIEKAREGWQYGPVKDHEKKVHPNLVSYEQLPVEQRLKDYIFAAIVEAFWKARTTEIATSA